MNDWSTLKKLIWQRGALGGDDGYVTVTGETPLTLPDAKAAPIKSLIQYGKIATVDGEFYCNNGKIVAVDTWLGADYKRITGIKFDGDFYYDTGITLNGYSSVAMTLANTSTQGQNVFGSYNGANKPNFSLFIYGGGSTSNSYFRYGTQLLRPRFGSNEHAITLDGYGTSGFQTDASTSDLEEFETEATAYIGMLPNSTSPGYTGSIIGSIVLDGWRAFIPCERVADGVIGYFDIDEGIFLEPIGSGTPVKGAYDMSGMTSYRVEGRVETITVGGRTVYVPDLFSTGDVKDEIDIITGEIKSRVDVRVLDGQISFLTPSTTGRGWYQQPLNTVEGDNVLATDVPLAIGDVELSVTYKTSG